MRIEIAFAEWLSLFFFTFFTALGWRRPLGLKVRLKITALGLGADGLLLFVLYFATSNSTFETFRRLLPLLLIPMAYFQTGQFAAPLNSSLQEWLEQIDNKVFRFLRSLNLPASFRGWLTSYGEVTYLLCYPMVPSGVVVLYLAGILEAAAEFWAVVLPPTYLCYATLPFVRTSPPWAVESPGEHGPPTKIRKLNGFVLHHLSHRANTFPSGHAAASVAVALVLTHLTPAVGWVYLVIAASIMAGAFVGRYHFAADVLIGAVFAVVSFYIGSLVTSAHSVD